MAAGAATFASTDANEVSHRAAVATASESFIGPRSIDVIRHRALAKPEHQRLLALNMDVNTFVYDLDLNRWQTPAELAANGYGDCKDYALAKFFLLRSMGVPANKVRLGYALAKYAGGPWERHLVVLLWTDAGEPLVLDNLTDVMRRLNEREDLKVLYSFNESQWFLAHTSEQIRSKRLRHWPDVWHRTVAASGLPVTPLDAPLWVEPASAPAPFTTPAAAAPSPVVAQTR